jgi:hypothetical protein
MKDYFFASATDFDVLEYYANVLLSWKEQNPGGLCKIGGSQDSLPRHQDPAQYNPFYFDRDNAIVFPGTFTDSRQAAWLELKLIQIAFKLGIGVNKARDSARNMANLPGEDYSSTSLGCVYLLPGSCAPPHHNTRRLLQSACKQAQ